jgi:hypothetical protein
LVAVEEIVQGALLALLPINEPEELLHPLVAFNCGEGGIEVIREWVLSKEGGADIGRYPNTYAVEHEGADFVAPVSSNARLLSEWVGLIPFARAIKSPKLCAPAQCREESSFDQFRYTSPAQSVIERQALGGLARVSH